MYVTYADGNMMKNRDIQKVELLLVRNGKMFRRTLNVHYALLGKISFLKNNCRYIAK